MVRRHSRWKQRHHVGVRNFDEKGVDGVEADTVGKYGLAAEVRLKLGSWGVDDNVGSACEPPSDLVPFEQFR